LEERAISIIVRNLAPAKDEMKMSQIGVFDPIEPPMLSGVPKRSLC